MGSLVNSAAAILFTSLLALLFGVSTIFCQHLTERNARCNEDGCFVAYFQQKTFLNSWRACREKGGNLAITKHKKDADAVANLFSHSNLPNSRTDVLMWIGLQRQPRQCTAAHPLRGFSWTTGDQDTEYTNWQEEGESSGSCSTPRCVVLTYSTQERKDNFKWLDRSCSVTVEGYICHFAYKGMCAALWTEGTGHILYKTPFGQVSSLLTHVPFGSVASVPCSSNTEAQSVSCTVKDDGSVGWSRDSPLCPNSFVHNRCDKDNGGCEHFCRLGGAHFYCECAQGYRLGENGQSCELFDGCQESRCEFECVPLPDDYRCACPEGYMLASDGRSCLDVDECLQSPCEQLCVNTPGAFQCQCGDGYNMEGEGVCEDVDECLDNPCEHVCENTPGSHVCHCYLGFLPALEDTSRCQEIDECQESGTCQHMCVNSEGGYDCYCEEGYELRSDLYSCRKTGEVDDQSAVTSPYPWVTHQPGPAWHSDNYEWTQTDWAPEGEQHLDWLTDQPSVLGSDVIWVTSANQDDVSPDPATQRPERETDKSEESSEVDGLEWEQRPQSEQEAWTNTIYTTPSSDTESSTTPYWYEVDEEETTASTPPPFTSTMSGGAWNWLATLTTTNQGAVDPDRSTPVDYTDSDGGKNQYSYWENSPIPEEQESDFLGSTKSQAEAASTQLTASPPSSKAGDGGDDVDSVQNRGPHQTSTWLLVGILVPICIFIVVMVVLAITFCTRCAVHPRSKEATNCYHWISGAHDKQGASNPSGGGAKSHV